MINIENTEVVGLEHAIRGMRNPMNSWARSDSYFDLQIDGPDDAFFDDELFVCGHKLTDRNTYYDVEDANWYIQERPIHVSNAHIGPNDADLMRRLNAGGPVHAKYRRMIGVYCDITAPLYWWKEFDTYKVGTVANSCSTMHKIHAREFTIDDFSHEHIKYARDSLDAFVLFLNTLRTKYLSIKDENPTEAKEVWYEMIQLLPSSYNQKRTVYLNYEVLVGMYKWRKNHKLDEWREFCKTMEDVLPYSWIFTGKDLDTKE